MRFKFDKAKSRRLPAKRGIGFEEVQELFYAPYYLDSFPENQNSGSRSAG